MKPSSLRWLFLALLLLRTALFIRAAAWAPADYVGDFATDYHPRAQFLAEHGRLPTQADMANDLYLRPPGTSLLLAIPIAAGKDWRGVVHANRIANLWLDALMLGGILFWLSGLRAAATLKMAMGLAVLAQPWTAGFALLPGSDTLNMVVLTAAVYAAAGAQRRLADGHDARGLAWTLGVLVGISLLLRAETLAWLALLGVWSAWLVWRHRRAGQRLLLASWAPIVVALAMCSAYSSHVRQDLNLWRTDHRSFAENGVNRWLRTWPGDEQTKTGIAFYWFRGLNLSMESVPQAALRAPGQAESIKAALAQTPAGQPMPDAAQREFARLAEENRAREPWMATLVVPLAHLGTMVWNAGAFPEFDRLLGRIAPALAATLPAALLCSLLIGVILLVLHWQRLRRWPGAQTLALLSAAAVLARMSLFAALLNYPENRYLLPCWPLLLLLSMLGWLAACTRTGDMPRAGSFLPSTPV